MLWPMLEPAPAPADGAPHGPAVRRRAGTYGLLAASLLGAGSALAFAAARSWRAAGLGLHDLPVAERWIVAMASAFGFALGCAIEARGRSPWPLAVGLWFAVVVATATTALGGPAWAAQAVAVWPSLALPAAAAAALCGAIAAARGGSAAIGGFAAVLGAGLALVATPFAAASWSVQAGAGAVFLLAAAACVPGRAVVPPRRTLRQLAAMALPVGGCVAWAFGLGEGLGPAPSVWPAADAAPAFVGAALGFLLADRTRPAHAARLNGITTAALAILAAAPPIDSVLRTSALGCALAVLGRSALGNASTREVLHALARAALGAGLVALAVASGLSAGVATAVLAVVASLTLVRATAIGGFSTVAGGFAVVVFGGALPSPSAAGDLELGRHGCALATWSPRTQQLALSIDGAVVDRAGPGRDHATVLAFLAAAFAERTGPVFAFGPDCGRLAEVAGELGVRELVGAGACDDTSALAAVLATDGPVLGPDPRPRASAPPLTLGSRELLHDLPAAAASAVVDASLLGPATATRATVEEHAAMRRAAGRGPVLQAFALDATPPSLVENCLRSAAAVHAHASLFVVGDSVVVLGLGDRPDWERARARLGALSSSARWRLHQAGIGDLDDLRDAQLVRLQRGRCAPTDLDVEGVRLDDASGGRPAVVAALERALEREVSGLARTRLDAWSGDAAREQAALRALQTLVAERPESVLLRREWLAVGVRNADRVIAAAESGKPESVQAARALAVRFFHVGSPSPSLQAALALPDAKGEAVRDRRAAGRAALALDAGFADAAPAVLRSVLAGQQAHTPLADLGRLPAAERLVELAVGDGPFAIALRQRFGSRCAEALVGALARAELALPAQSALRELADPFVLARALDALRGRDADLELVRAWRSDLPTCAAIRSVFELSATARQAVLVAAGGRLDAGSLELVAKGLDDEQELVRSAAATALFRSLGDRIVYDPAWPAERRRAAARELLELAQRNPR